MKPEKSEVVYHYTSGDGLLGIMKSRSLWCTHLYYLNDAMEYKHGQELYVKMLVEVGDDESHSQIVRDFARVALDHFIRQETVKEENSLMLTNPDAQFVASFSSKDDDLAQWRGYSPKGPRFSIGFFKSELQKLEDLQQMCFAQVNYDSSQATNKMKEAFFIEQAKIIDKFMKPPLIHPRQIHPPEYTRMNDRICSIIQPLQKHEKFKDEEEWRLYNDFSYDRPRPFMNHANESFRVGTSFLVPYVGISLEELDCPIASITVGPTPHKQEAEAAVRRLTMIVRRNSSNFIATKMDGTVDIRSSDIPFRDW